MSNRVVPPAAVKLKKARKLIEKKENWCRFRFRQKTGHFPFYTKQYCAIGSIQAVTNNAQCRNMLESELNQSAGELYGIFGIMALNDSRGHDAVLKCFDDAYERIVEKGVIK